MGRVSLEDREWGAVILGVEFEITATHSGVDKKNLSGRSGRIPYITRTDRDNGIDAFIGSQGAITLDEGNAITIGLDTQSVHYQPSAFYTGQNIQVLRHSKLNRYNALFVVRAVRCFVQKFSWGSYGATLTRLKRGRILLPLIGAQVDWEFMSTYMRQLEEDILAESVPRMRAMLDEDRSPLPALDTKEWKPFFMKDVLSIANGVRLTKADRIDGSRPFIGASETRNGVTGFTGSMNASLDSGVLGVNYNGSVGFAFYHPYEALFSDDVKRVRIGDTSANNQYALLFLAMVIKQQRGKYAYGYKFNLQRMQRQILLLPTTPQGTPDWQFMSDYMRTLEAQTLRGVLDRL